MFTLAVHTAYTPSVTIGPGASPGILGPPAREVLGRQVQRTELGVDQGCDLAARPDQYRVGVGLVAPLLEPRH